MQRAGRALGLLALALALLAGSLAAPAAAQTAGTQAADRALAWMKGQQQADGSFPGFGPGSTADAIFAIAARGQSVAGYTVGGTSPLDFLATKVPDLTKTAGGAAKLALAVQVAGGNPRSFGGADLTSIIDAQLDQATGHYGQDVTGQALVILAYLSMSQLLHPKAYEWLVAQQGPEGGWSFGGDKSPGAADTNTTGLALQALGAGTRGVFDTAIARALAYLRTQQNADGGFPYSQTDPNSNASDANSTAMVILGLVAVGQDPAGAGWARGVQTPAQALAAFQNPGGAFRYQAALPDDNAGATYQAVPALLHRPLPLQGGLSPAPGMPTTGAADPAALWPLSVALGLLVGGVLLRRAAGRRGCVKREA
jgi:hypothetical protein